MNRLLRDMRKMIRKAGLIEIAIDCRKRHYRIKVKNPLGMEAVRTLSLGSKQSPKDMANEMAELKRFARGDTHGLIMTKPR